MTDVKWEAIAPLTDADRGLDLAATRALYDTWRASRTRMEAESSANLNEFTRRLVRRLSVETGILERLYDLDRGTTEALVATGFVEDLVSRSSTNIEPSRLIDILHDHEAAIQLVMDCVAGSRDLTKSLMHELHTILTRHQDTTTAVDQFGNRIEIRLLKGRFKELPNNPRRSDGSVHEYAPPVHVDSEVENLFRWLREYESEDPVLIAAWFHHRFTQIHPYQDGNGRVARALTTLILLRADLLPIVVDRDLRGDYIRGLEAADRGDLSSVVGLFARLEQAAILQALSVDTDAEVSQQKTVTSAVIDTLADKFDKRRQAKTAELRRVNDLARSLRTTACSALSDTLGRLAKAVSEIAEPEIFVAEGGPDRGNAHWYKSEVVESARAGGKFANFSEDHYFVKATIRADRERLVFVTSFHHVGRELSGIMEGTAFAQLESFEDSDDRKFVFREFFVCSFEPFVFTHGTTEQQVHEAFSRWLDGALAVAVKEYGDRL